MINLIFALILVGSAVALWVAANRVEKVTQEINAKIAQGEKLDGN